MLDIKFVRENSVIVKENIKKKFQDDKLPLVDEVIKLDEEYRKIKTKLDELRSERNKKSTSIGTLMREGKKEEAEQVKLEVSKINEEIAKDENLEQEYEEKIKRIMMSIPNIIDGSVPIGKDDTENVETDEVWVRPYDLFNSLVDKEKYPDIKQKYRFEKIKGEK